MTTGQIIVLLIIGILSVIGFAGSVLSEDVNKRLEYNILLFFTVTCLFLISILSTTASNQYYKEKQGKCPEYEKIDNVYRLK